MASVYFGRRDGVPLACKLYRAGLPGWKKRPERERAAQEAVDHPCVARLLGSGTTADGASYLLSEWIEGDTMSERLATAGRLDWAELHPIAEALARGLGSVHQKGMVHRDVKPSNIMLPRVLGDRVSGGVAAKLLDFGHVFPCDSERLTQSGDVLGSAAYMAPEHATDAPMDGRTDLYSLGVVLYEALTGELPFNDESAAVVLRQHQHEPVLSPRLRAPDANIQQIVEDLVLWLLTKDPAGRVPNVRVLLHALKSAAPSAKGDKI